MKLTVLKYGVTDLSESMFFKGGDSQKRFPISLLFFLLETENKKILIDAGCDTMPGFTLYEFKKPVDVLRELDLEPDDITDVIVTHSHHDHTDCVKYYKNATVHLCREAYEETKGYLKNAKELNLFEDTFEIAEGVEIRRIGGHSKGSSIVVIKNKDDIYVLCGDECYSKENLDLNILTGSSICPEKSMAFLEEYRKPCYKQILFHDPDIVNKIGTKVLF